MERKLASLEALEVKFDGEGRFEGYASMFNGVDSYGDTIHPGAYLNTIPSLHVTGEIGRNLDRQREFT